MNQCHGSLCLIVEMFWIQQIWLIELLWIVLLGWACMVWSMEEYRLLLLLGVYLFVTHCKVRVQPRVAYKHWLTNTKRQNALSSLALYDVVQDVFIIYNIFATVIRRCWIVRNTPPTFTSTPSYYDNLSGLGPLVIFSAPLDLQRCLVLLQDSGI